MEKTYKINAMQLFIIFAVSRVFWCFASLPQNAELSAMETIISIVLSSFLNFLIFLLVVSLSKKFRDNDKKTNNKLINVLIIAFCVFMAVECLTQFENFMASTIYLTSTPVFFLIPLIVVAICICSLGIEGIARLSGFVLAGVIISVIAITIASFSKIDTIWIDRISFQNYKLVLGNVFENLSYTTEVVIFFVLFPFSKGNMKKGALFFAVTTGIIIEVVTILNITVLGDYRRSIMFPFYTVAAMSENSMSDRFNAAYIVLFVFVATIRLSLYLFSALKSLRRIVYFKNDIIFLIFLSILIFSISLISTNEITSISILHKIIITGVPTFVCGVLFPILLHFFKTKEKEIND